MYKILIKHLNRNLFEPYMVDTKNEVNTSPVEPNKMANAVCTCGQRTASNLDKVEYSTNDLVELSEKYKELLATYTTEQLKVVEELDVDVLVSIMNG